MSNFAARRPLTAGGTTYSIYPLDQVEGWARLPYCLKVLLENLLRQEAEGLVGHEQVQSLASFDPDAPHGAEVQLAPSRVLLQDFTGVPCVVDLAAMRDAMAGLGGDPSRINPKVPAELVIDHSVVTEAAGRRDAFRINAEVEAARNRERYQLLRWAQQAFHNLSVVPPDTGICHQVNLEHLARVVFSEEGPDGPVAYPDTLVGTDSHTTMVNGLGVLGWGVGGIEAEAAMLGQPITMLVPQVVGVRLTGELAEGATATDLVLTVAELLRRIGVVGKMVEFFGAALASIPLANRATIANMSPEYGSTCAIFPIDPETLSYLRLTGRPEDRIALVEAYAKAQGLWHEPDHPATYSQVVDLDLGSVEPSIAGPRRPQDRISLRQAHREVGTMLDPSHPIEVTFPDGRRAALDHGHVVIAAITSCTNTSNPEVMVAAGLLAKAAVERGLEAKPWVKTSLAPGSRVVSDYLDRAGLTPYLDKLGFSLVGYGCTTCIGNSGPLIEEVGRAVEGHDLTVCSVLSGNRNFEGRIHPQCKMNFLCSPPLVVAYALAGTMRADLAGEPLGHDREGRPVYLKDIWPSAQEVHQVIGDCLRAEMFGAGYGDLYAGNEAWRTLPVPEGDMFSWDPSSTYVRRPPYFDGIGPEPGPLKDITGARVLVLLGDSVTTDHISPAGSIKADSPAGRYLMDHGVEPADFNSYGARRGNHEVMVRGTFANIRLRNLLVSGVEGGVTRHLPDGAQMPIYDAAMAYANEGVPLIVVAGAEYGSGSSRDWAAKGPLLLGVRAVLARSFERIHRSNLIGMGILPLELPAWESASSLGLSGEGVYSITGLEGPGPLPKEVTVRVDQGQRSRQFKATVRIDTPAEEAYYRHGGILQHVLRQLLAG
jgi:aconitate hydratase